jgi:hypothetical protein
VVVTADALQTHHDAAEFLVTSKQAHYLFTVKANQFTVKANQSVLLDRCAAMPWHNVGSLCSCSAVNLVAVTAAQASRQQPAGGSPIVAALLAPSRPRCERGGGHPGSAWRWCSLRAPDLYCMPQHLEISALSMTSPRACAEPDPENHP